MIVPARLLDAYRKTGWSLDELTRRAGLSCSRPSIHRKIHGKQVVSLDEYSKLAKLFGFSLVLAGSKVRLKKGA